MSPTGARRFVPPALLLLAAIAPLQAQETKRSDDAFKATEIWQVRIHLSAEEYEAMQPRNRGILGIGATPKPAADKKEGREIHRNNFGVDLPWATGSVTLGDRNFKKVGIRYKGNGTIGDAAKTAKKSFKIDLDYFGETETYRQRKTINLHCEVSDPSRLRETLGYGIYRAAGVPAPRTAFAEVRLNVPGKFDDHFLGLYTVVEHVDKRFLRDHFGSDKGLLMKPEGVRDFSYKGDDWNIYKGGYQPKREPTADEVKRILAFCKLVQQPDDGKFRKEIDSHLDIEGYLRFLAATSFIANADCFFVTSHNYFLYLHPKTGRLHFAPWDLDRSFVNFPILGSNEQTMDLSFTRPYGGEHRLTERLLAIPEVIERYQALLRELSAEAFRKDRLEKQLDTLEKTIEELKGRDAQAIVERKEQPYAPPPFFGIPPGLRLFLAKRSESLAAQLAGASIGHISSGGFRPAAIKAGDAMARPLFVRIDVERDGHLSKDEWVAATKKLFDGCEHDTMQRIDESSLARALSKILPKPPLSKAIGATLPAFKTADFIARCIVRRADADKDGKVSHDEWNRAATKAFDDFDRIKAGKLTEPMLSALLSDVFPMPSLANPAAWRK
ncbi:MAG: CotH kinase family protein [Gemmataceae bacterium]|nr:CotH kinase family protein [Gemmataceae bacterium]